MKVAIVGLGYVGMPLAIQFARSNVEVLGVDIDVVKVEMSCLQNRNAHREAL